MAKELAGLTPGLVGADIDFICDTAAKIAAKQQASAVSMLCFSEAIDR